MLSGLAMTSGAFGSTFPATRFDDAAAGAATGAVLEAVALSGNPNGGTHRAGPNERVSADSPEHSPDVVIKILRTECLIKNGKQPGIQITP